MNRKELVSAALAHREPPVIPHHMDFTAQALDRLREYTGDDDIEEKLGACLHYVQYWGWPTEIEGMPGYFRDEFGVIWDRTGLDKDIGVVRDPQITDLTGSDYVFPSCDTDRLRRDIEALIASRGDRFTMMGFGFCMFERAWSLMGMENVYMSMAVCPDELELFFDRICDYYLPLIDIALEYDVDGIYFGDDWGQQNGLLFGAKHWRRFIKPRIARFYERVKSRNKYVMQHSCGDCHEILPDLIELGLDCYQTFQPEIYDIRAIKREYGRDLTFWGGVSVQKALPYMGRDELIAEIASVADALRSDGGFIIAPTHAITPDIPPENILTMAEVFLNQGKYLKNI
ncbi:MAG: uroporphyrinogen decarboxylase [Clostridiales Family XIII bacterium]|jgi:uroporphyrinogen decarboxylase|nr:uroporphyrinogen decarboxylase [Clostridiales Family XIII bacterium]